MTLSQLQASSAAPWLAPDICGRSRWTTQCVRHPFLPWPSSTDPRMCSRETLASSNWKASSWCWKTRLVNQRRLAAPGWLWGWPLGLGIEVGDSIDSIACQVGTEALKHYSHYRPWFNSFSGLTLFYTFLWRQACTTCLIGACR